MEDFEKNKEIKVNVMKIPGAIEEFGLKFARRHLEKGRNGRMAKKRKGMSK